MTHVMNTGQKTLGVIVLLASSIAAAQSYRKKPASTIDIVAVRSNGVDLKIRSVWPYPVSVQVCDTPRRLNELGYYLEGYTGKKWMRLKPREGRFLGDLKPEYLEIGEGRTDSLPASVYPATFGAKANMRLRIVVRAWRTERDAIGVVSTVNQEPLLLTSDPFVLKPSEGTSPH